MNYILKRWRQVKQLFLEKDKNFPKMHRFRNINLIKADLNFVMSLIWAKKTTKIFRRDKITTRISIQRQEKQKGTERNSE